MSSTASYGQGARVALYDFESEESRDLFDGAFPRFAEGHILFARYDFLWAVPFDQDALKLPGEPFFVQEDVARPRAIAQFQMAQDGTPICMPASAWGSAPIPVWVIVRGGWSRCQESRAVRIGAYAFPPMAPVSRSKNYERRPTCGFTTSRAGLSAV